MKKCPYCGAELNNDSLFCTECGKELPIGVVCPHCGAPINEGDVFCTECGKRTNEVSQTTSVEPTKHKCPHCGASINEGDAFCMECGKKIDEASKSTPTPTTSNIKDDVDACTKCDKTENGSLIENTTEKNGTDEDVNTRDSQIIEDEEEIENNYDFEEEPKTWSNYKLPILGGFFIVLLIGLCWMYYDSSSKRATREKAIADSIEVVRQDSIIKAKAKMDEEAEKQKQEEESVKFCKQFSVEDLICLIENYENPQKAEESGLSFIYKDAVNGGEYGDDIEIVYGKFIEKGDKKNLGFSLKGTTSHSCFFQVELDTSTQMNICFSNEEDAKNFFNKVSEYGVIEYEGTYYIPKMRLTNDKPIHVDSLEWDGDYAPLYYIDSPKYREGYYKINTGVPC